MKSTRPILRLGPDLAEDFDRAVSAFLRQAEARNLSPNTLDWYGRMLRPLVKFAEGLSPAQISRTHLQEFLLSIPFSAANKNAHLRAVRAFFGWLHREGYLLENPAAGLPMVKEFRRVLPVLSAAQAQALLRVIDTSTWTGRRDYALCVLLLDCGARISEVLGANVSDVDWAESTLLVMGKGGKQRRVPFGNLAKRALVKWLEARGEIPGQEALFVNRYGERLRREQAHKLIQGYGKKARITGVRVSPHSLRYTFACSWLRNGGDLLTLKRILGHSSWKMVEHYASQTASDLVAKHGLHSPIDRLLRRTPGTSQGTV